MSRKTNNKILKEHLILCEGRDEQEFLIQFLESDTLSFLPGFSITFEKNTRKKGKSMVP